MVRVLLVEDENVIRRFLVTRTRWSALGCEVVGEATNGKDGLDKILELNPDIVITDVRMPLMDGLEMLQKARRTNVFEAIILSAFSDFAYAQKALSLSACEYLLKPINTVQMEMAIKKACNRLELANKLRIEALRAESPQDDVLGMSHIDSATLNLSAYVKEMFTYIRKNYKNKISINEFGRRYSVSTTYLNRIFKKELGYPFNDFLNRYRIRIATSMLKNNTGFVYEIAEKTGFEEYKYFARVFRKYMGCTPSEFKKCFLQTAERPSTKPTFHL